MHRINSSKILVAAPRIDSFDLSRLVHQRAARKPLSDARTATYVILSSGSGPGGRWFKSIRPDHFNSRSPYHLRCNFDSTRLPDFRYIRDN